MCGRLHIGQSLTLAEPRRNRQKINDDDYDNDGDMKKQSIGLQPGAIW